MLHGTFPSHAKDVVAVGDVIQEIGTFFSKGYRVPTVVVGDKSILGTEGRAMVVKLFIKGVPEKGQVTDAIFIRRRC